MDHFVELHKRTMGKKYECINCGNYYYPSDSIAANTTTELATMYCSRICEDKDKEHMNSQLELAKEQSIAREAATAEAEAHTTTVVTAGGFRMKIQKERV